VRKLLGLTAAAILMSLPVTPVQATAEEPMGVGEAGDYYLEHACRYAAAGDRFERVVWHGEETIPKAAIRRRLPQIKTATSRFARAIARMSNRLYNPPAPWPQSVQGLASRLADATADYGDTRKRQGKADNAEEWMRLNRKANRVNFHNYGEKIRDRLDLPPPGKGC
jgi:hypothetical protein